MNTFSISQEVIPLTIAVQNAADYAAVKSITLAFYNSDGTEQYKSTQLRAGAATFGSFSLSLPYGSYKMVVIAHEGDFPITLSSLSEANFGGEKPKDTFLYSQDLVIENSTPVNLSAVLERIITRLIVISTDPKPDNVKDIRISFSKGGTAFNPVSGFAAPDGGFVNTITPNTAAAGDITKLRTTFFIGALEDDLDVTIGTLDASGTVLNTRLISPHSPPR